MQHALTIKQYHTSISYSIAFKLLTPSCNYNSNGISVVMNGCVCSMDRRNKQCIHKFGEETLEKHSLGITKNTREKY